MEKPKFRLGKGIEVKESSKSVKKNEEKYFLDLIEILCQIEMSSKIAESIGINLVTYEDLHLKAIEMLLEKQYGDDKTTIIMWWVFESISPDGEIYPLIDEKGGKHVIKTPLQLYKFLKKQYGN